jgi:hypothetical protein
MTLEFREFPKIPRLKREVIVTEKIDGTNACIAFDAEGNFIVQSRGRIITPEDDNFGFAGWVSRNLDELRKLGEGHHYGEWWGPGIQRGYGQAERRFSLFNTFRWNKDNPNLPGCCHVVPLLGAGDFSVVDAALEKLRTEGSAASPGFMRPEGIVVYHSAARSYFKVTLDKDEERKGAA